jgi:hypothetical protein
MPPTYLEKAELGCEILPTADMSAAASGIFGIADLEVRDVRTQVLVSVQVEVPNTVK